MILLQNPIWQFIITLAVTLFVGVAAVVTSVAIYQRQKNHKEIIYEIISNTPVLSILKEVKDKVKVLFDGKDVSDPQLVILRLLNAGNVPILAEDYKEGKPITIDFGKEAQILYAEIIETKPINMKDIITLKTTSGILILEPFLFNSKESVKLKVLVAQPDTSINVEARIVGGQIKNSDEITSTFKAVAFNTLITIVIVLLIGLVVFIFGYFANAILNTLTSLFGLLVASTIWAALFVDPIFCIIFFISFAERKNKKASLLTWIVYWLLPFIIINIAIYLTFFILLYLI